MGLPQAPVSYGDLCTDLINDIWTVLGVEAFQSVPSPRLPEFVLVVDVGGGEDHEFASTTRIGFECWSTNDAAARALCERVRTHLRTMVGARPDGSWIVNVEIISTAAFAPDVESRQSRYRMTANIRRSPIQGGTP